MPKITCKLRKNAKKSFKVIFRNEQNTDLWVVTSKASSMQLLQNLCLGFSIWCPQNFFHPCSYMKNLNLWVFEGVKIRGKPIQNWESRTENRKSSLRGTCYRKTFKEVSVCVVWLTHSTKKQQKQIKQPITHDKNDICWRRWFQQSMVQISWLRIRLLNLFSDWWLFWH